MLGDDGKEALRAGLAAEPSVRLAYLFGSQARGDAGPNSDVDLAVWTEPRLSLIELGAVAERIGRAIPVPLDLVDLRETPPLLARQVVAEGEALLVRDADLKLDFELETVRRYEDTRPLRAVQQRLLKELVGHGRAA